MNVNAYLYCIGFAVYGTLSVLIVIQARQNVNTVLAICCAVTAIWAASGAAWSPISLDGLVGFLDLIRLLTWYIYLLYLYRRSEVASSAQIRGFSSIAWGGVFASISLLFLSSTDAHSYSVFSWPIAIRLFICISELLLIENLYFNLPESARWHIALPCILLGGLACFDILVVADTALFRRPSVPLESGRVIAMIIVAPLLVLAASRGQRWNEPIRLSRAAVFHSATLVLSGSVLLSLAIAGEVLRHLDETWGWVAELSLVFAGIIGIMLFISSRSARSLMDRMVVYHFFADRYDYRSEWLSCIQTLSGSNGDEQSALYTRAIKAVADIVDSPSGALFTIDSANESMAWSGSWNMRSTTNIPVSHPLLRKLINNHEVVDLQKAEMCFSTDDPIGQLGSVWLALPLRHSSNTIGCIVVGPPRVPFRLDQEVFDLLGILGQEVGTYIAEQQATEAVYQTRSLHDYGKRFAFVAHDIKNVSSQLALLLANAEHHISNPEFQDDMLATVRASVQKIGRLLTRLDEPAAKAPLPSISLATRIEALVQTYRRAGRLNVSLVHDGSDPRAFIGIEAFDTAITHLLNNAVEASPTRPVLISLKSDAEVAAIEIRDQGEGMSSEFIRDELFLPFRTKRVGGSGIGAFQARELINEAGGKLLVESERGTGTTMRILFSRADEVKSSSDVPQALTFGPAGGAVGR